jgi:hypothetical protein
MLNQLTMRDYEKRIDKFDFTELVTKEAPADIARAVFTKVAQILVLMLCR